MFLDDGKQSTAATSPDICAAGPRIGNRRSHRVIRDLLHSEVDLIGPDSIARKRSRVSPSPRPLGDIPLGPHGDGGGASGGRPRPGPGSGVTVNAVNQFGEALPGDHFTVFRAIHDNPYNGQGEDMVATGVTGSTFEAAAGSAYSLQVYAYGSCAFSHWSDGALSDPVAFTATGSALSFTAVYNCVGAIDITHSSIFVSSEYTSGAALTGMYAVLQQGGSTVSTGFTPVTFTTTSGTTYSVTVADYTSAYFSQWSNNVSSRTIDVTATGSQTSLTALYCQTQGGCSSGGGGGGGAAITVSSSDLHTGAAITGMYVDLRLNDNSIQSGYTPVTFSGLQTGVQYLVVVYWYGSYYFRHFSNGDLQRYELVTLNSTSGQSTISLDALYENIPKSQAASLNLIAQFPNGTQIGTASEDNGYPQHTPGMYLTVTPPGSGPPFTATFTGGSILPFIFFNGDTYTVQMSTGYSNITFAYWKDNGSTNPTRSFRLDGNATYIAIYIQG